MWLKEQNKRIKEGKGLAKSLSGRKLVSDKAECIFFRFLGACQQRTSRTRADVDT